MVVNGLPGDPVSEVVREIVDAGGTAIGHEGDVGTEEGAQGCIEAARSAYGRLDILVANAGLFPEQTDLAVSLERFEELLHTNIRGVYLPVRAALPELRKSKGCILAAGSEAGLHGLPHAVSYGATKGWVIAFDRGVAAEQARYGVRANVVAPGPIDTEMTRPSKGNMTVKNALMAVGSVPLGAGARRKRPQTCTSSSRRPWPVSSRVPSTRWTVAPRRPAGSRMRPRRKRGARPKAPSTSSTSTRVAAH